VDTVALAATIGGSVVALAGVGVTAWGIRQQRLSSREVAELQHGHERVLARGARLFDRRANVYEEMLVLVFLWADRVEDVSRLMRLANDPDPPDVPTREEWRGMQARLGTIRSKRVADGFAEFVEALGNFFEQVVRVRNIRLHGGRTRLRGAPRPLNPRRPMYGPAHHLIHGTMKKKPSFPK
jgi:hypothetical protein